MSRKYSVLVPVYNVEKYIGKCIESVLKQTYTNFELILVDDGTPDKSGEICEEYAQNDSRIKVFHKENQGQIHTRKYAIEKANGDYYVFLDSDDTLKSDALEIINEKIERYDCDCIIYGLEKVEAGRVVAQICDLEEQLLCDKREIYRKVFFSTDYNSLCRKVVKSSVFHDVDYSPFYHLRYTEDLLQSLEIYKYSKTIVFIPDVLYEYRMNETSITHGPTRMIVDYTIRTKVFEFILNESVFSEDEVNQFRDFCIGMVIGDIVKFSISHESYDNIKSRINQIRNDIYYQNFLSKGISNRRTIGFKSFVFDMFRHKKDVLMISLIKIVYFFIRIKH